MALAVLEEIDVKLNDVYNIRLNPMTQDDDAIKIELFASLLSLYDDSWKIQNTRGLIGLNGKLETNPDILKPAVHKKIKRYLNLTGLGHLVGENQNLLEKNRFPRIITALMDKLEHVYGTQGVKTKVRAVVQGNAKKALKRGANSDAREHLKDVELNTEARARPGANDDGLVDSCKPADSCNIGDSCKPDDSLSPMTIIPAGRQIPRTPPQILETKPSTPSSSRQTTPLDGLLGKDDRRISSFYSPDVSQIQPHKRGVRTRNILGDISWPSPHSPVSTHVEITKRALMNSVGKAVLVDINKVQTPVGKNDVQSSDEENFMVVNVIPSGKQLSRTPSLSNFCPPCGNKLDSSNFTPDLQNKLSKVEIEESQATWQELSSPQIQKNKPRLEEDSDLGENKSEDSTLIPQAKSPDRPPPPSTPDLSLVPTRLLPASSSFILPPTPGLPLPPTPDIYEINSQLDLSLPPPPSPLVQNLSSISGIDFPPPPPSDLLPPPSNDHSLPPYCNEPTPASSEHSSSCDFPPHPLGDVSSVFSSSSLQTILPPTDLASNPPTDLPQPPSSLIQSEKETQSLTKPTRLADSPAKEELISLRMKRIIPTGNQLLNTPQLKVADERQSQEPGGHYRLPSDLENIAYPSACKVGMEVVVEAKQVREEKNAKVMKEAEVVKEKKEAKKIKNVKEVTCVTDEKEANHVIKKVKHLKEIMISTERKDVMDVKNMKDRKKEKEVKETKKMKDVVEPQACDFDVVKRENTLKRASPRPFPPRIRGVKSQTLLPSSKQKISESCDFQSAKLLPLNEMVIPANENETQASEILTREFSNKSKINLGQKSKQEIEKAEINLDVTSKKENACTSRKDVREKNTSIQESCTKTQTQLNHGNNKIEDQTPHPVEVEQERVKIRNDSKKMSKSESMPKQMSKDDLKVLKEVKKQKILEEMKEKNRERVEKRKKEVSATITRAQAAIEAHPQTVALRARKTADPNMKNVKKAIDVSKKKEDEAQPPKEIEMLDSKIGADDPPRNMGTKSEPPRIKKDTTKISKNNKILILPSTETESLQPNNKRRSNTELAEPKNDTEFVLKLQRDGDDDQERSSEHCTVNTLESNDEVLQGKSGSSLSVPKDSEKRKSQDLEVKKVKLSRKPSKKYKDDETGHILSDDEKHQELSVTSQTGKPRPVMGVRNLQRKLSNANVIDGNSLRPRRSQPDSGGEEDLKQISGIIESYEPQKKIRRTFTAKLDTSDQNTGKQNDCELVENVLEKENSPSKMSNKEQTITDISEIITTEEVPIKKTTVFPLGFGKKVGKLTETAEDDSGAPNVLLKKNKVKELSNLLKNKAKQESDYKKAEAKEVMDFEKTAKKASDLKKAEAKKALNRENAKSEKESDHKKAEAKEVVDCMKSEALEVSDPKKAVKEALDLKKAEVKEALNRKKAEAKKESDQKKAKAKEALDRKKAEAKEALYQKKAEAKEALDRKKAEAKEALDQKKAEANEAVMKKTSDYKRTKGQDDKNRIRLEAKESLNINDDVKATNTRKSRMSSGVALKHAKEAVDETGKEIRKSISSTTVYLESIKTVIKKGIEKSGKKDSFAEESKEDKKSARKEQKEETVLNPNLKEEDAQNFSINMSRGKRMPEKKSSQTSEKKQENLQIKNEIDEVENISAATSKKLKKSTSRRSKRKPEFEEIEKQSSATSDKLEMPEKPTSRRSKRKPELKEVENISAATSDQLEKSNSRRSKRKTVPGSVQLEKQDEGFQSSKKKRGRKNETSILEHEIQGNDEEYIIRKDSEEFFTAPEESYVRPSRNARKRFDLKEVLTSSVEITPASKKKTKRKIASVAQTAKRTGKKTKLSSSEEEEFFSTPQR